MNNNYTYLLKQHIGVPSEATVAEGANVVRGQLIAGKPDDGLGANIFSGVSGKVVKVTADAISISEDGTDFGKFMELTEKDPLRLIEEAGIVGLGGAGFPTYAKLMTKLPKTGSIIVNAAECEPILTHNIKRIEEEAEKLLSGLRIAMDVVNVNNGIIGIKDKNKKAIDALNYANKDASIRIITLEDLYPMGEERAVIRELFGVTLPTDALPKEADAIVMNAETVFKIRSAVEDKKPLIDKDITVAGKLTENGSIKTFWDVPIGKSVEDIFEMAGGLGNEYGEIIMGGPFTGKRVTLTDPIIKTTGGLIASELFLKGPAKIGLLVCACGAGEERLTEIATSMGGEVTSCEYCKQAIKTGNTLKCENPGRCPGQVEKVMNLKKSGAEALLISNCTDCSNTVMSCAPKLGLPVYHCTDASLRAVNHKLIRRYNPTN